MITLKIQQMKSQNRTPVESFVENLKVYGVIKPLQKAYDAEGYDEKKLDQMRNLPKQTVGSDIAKMLDKHGLKLIPKFENHDLKHLILGYGMTTQEEIKMQAYLFGNGQRTLSCILFLLSGVLFPSSWREYYQDYKKGKNAPSILKLSIDDCMEQPTDEVRKEYTNYQKK